MSRIEHVRPVVAPWQQAHDVLGGSPDRWLPRPLAMTGTEHFRGQLRVLGVGMEIAYLVQRPWRDGTTVMRHVTMTPAIASLGRLRCEIVLQRADAGALSLRFTGETEARGSRLARLLGPPAARLVLRRFVSIVTSRLQLAANARSEPHS